MQYHAIPCKPCNTMQHHALPCTTMQYHAIPCNIVQYHASLITADGAYHCPVGSIWPFLISWPTFNDMDDPLLKDGCFQISLFLSSDIFFVLSWPNIKDKVDLPLNRWLLLHFSIFIFFVLWYDQPSMICSRHIKHSDPDDVSFVSLFLLPAIRKIIYTQS